MKLNIKTLNGKCEHVDVALDWTIGQLKQTIELRDKIIMGTIRLFFKDVELIDDDRRLSDFSFRDDDSVIAMKKVISSDQRKKWEADVSALESMSRQPPYQCARALRFVQQIENKVSQFLSTDAEQPQDPTGHHKQAEFVPQSSELQNMDSCWTQLVIQALINANFPAIKQTITMQPKLFEKLVADLQAQCQVDQMNNENEDKQKPPNNLKVKREAAQNIDQLEKELVLAPQNKILKVGEGNIDHSQFERKQDRQIQETNAPQSCIEGANNNIDNPNIGFFNPINDENNQQIFNGDQALQKIDEHEPQQIQETNCGTIFDLQKESNIDRTSHQDFTFGNGQSDFKAYDILNNVYRFKAREYQYYGGQILSCEQATEIVAKLLQQRQNEAQTQFKMTPLWHEDEIALLQYQVFEFMDNGSKYVEDFNDDDWEIIAANLLGKDAGSCMKIWQFIQTRGCHLTKWTKQEDEMLKQLVLEHGAIDWHGISDKLNNNLIKFANEASSEQKDELVLTVRTSQQCKERWHSALDRPNSNHILTFFIRYKEQIKISFLQFLDLKEIYKLSSTCRILKQIIDPKSFIAQQSNKSHQSQVHLKKIAAIQQLVNGDQLTIKEIDLRFGANVEQISDFKHMHGWIYKEQLINDVFRTKPPFEQYCFNDVSRYHEQWLMHGNSVDLMKQLGNPLESIVQKRKVSYNLGGVFTLKFINDASHFYSDYVIMIDSVGSRADYEKLMEIHEQSKLAENDPSKVKITKRDEIKHLLKGVGRKIRYICRNPNRIGEASQRQLRTWFDGTIDTAQNRYQNRFRVFSGGIFRSQTYMKIIEETGTQCSYSQYRYLLFTLHESEKKVDKVDFYEKSKDNSYKSNARSDFQQMPCQISLDDANLHKFRLKFIKQLDERDRRDRIWNQGPVRQGVRQNAQIVNLDTEQNSQREKQKQWMSQNHPEVMVEYLKDDFEVEKKKLHELMCYLRKLG